MAGVFFAPLERGELSEATNREVVARLENAGIPIVLLDRGFEPFPKRSRHDLVGIDNRLAAYTATAHLLQAGAPRVSFIGKKGGVTTILARIAGYREALFARDIRQSAVHRFDSVNAKSVKNILAASTPGDGFICANDRIAGKFMLSALALGYRIPRDVRIASIDDVEYASMLPIALTTVHQPCREIGEAAMTVMLDRIAHPRQLARDILLECRLVVRKSCGAI